MNNNTNECKINENCIVEITLLHIVEDTLKLPVKMIFSY